MKHIQLLVTLSDDLALKKVAIEFNTTELENNSELIKKVAFTILKALNLNKEDIQVQDLLNELGIERTPTKTL